MGLLVSFVSPLSHENGEHARRRPNGGYANPAQAADEANDKLDAAKNDLAALESQTGITASDSNGLPQTGVDASVPLSMMGILALAGAGVVYMRRKFEN